MGVQEELPDDIEGVEQTRKPTIPGPEQQPLIEKEKSSI
jgi:hypothetical protein